LSIQFGGEFYATKQGIDVIIGFDVQPFSVPFVEHSGDPSDTHSSMDTDAGKCTIRLGKRPVESPHDLSHCCTQFIASL
jgi:hypothetical protein